MAKATVVRKEFVVNLELTEQETHFLLQVLRHVGGPPDGPRGLGDGIANALHCAGGIDGQYNVDSERAGKGQMYFCGQER